MPAALPLRHAFDPRRSFAASIGWLITGLALGLASLAGWWEGDLARDALITQRAERAASSAEQWSNGLDAVLAQRRQPLQTAAAMLPAAVLRRDEQRLSAVFRDLQAGYPELRWIGLADARGRLLASTAGGEVGADASGTGWFVHGLRNAWIADGKGVASGADADAGAGATPPQDRHFWLAVPVKNAQGQPIGVVGARLDWGWVEGAAARLRQRLALPAHSDALLLDALGQVLIGPPDLVGLPVKPRAPAGFSSVPPASGGSLAALGWGVQLQWPEAEAARSADDARWQVVWLSLALGGLAALAGVALANRLTRRLARLTAAVQAVDPRAGEGIAVPVGVDEVSHLGRAFDALLGSLRTERDALASLTAELEQRVRSRTRDVERLAEENRYAAMVRERLRIARDLHDTLAHSMMAMLAEVRILRRLHQHDPAALADELAHAEQVAQAGLNEARAAILRMRFHGVRDLGLGAALGDAVAHFTARTGIAVAYAADPQAAGFADARAETVFRIAEEALRNIERHAGASQVAVRLQDGDHGVLRLVVQDDGIGFDTLAARPGHYGLVGLREQAQLIGATLAIDSTPGLGTTLRLGLGTEPDLAA